MKPWKGSKMHSSVNKPFYKKEKNLWKSYSKITRSNKSWLKIKYTGVNWTPKKWKRKEKSTETWNLRMWSKSSMILRWNRRWRMMSDQKWRQPKKRCLEKQTAWKSHCLLRANWRYKNSSPRQIQDWNCRWRRDKSICLNSNLSSLSRRGTENYLLKRRMNLSRINLGKWVSNKVLKPWRPKNSNKRPFKICWIASRRYRLQNTTVLAKTCLN